MLFWTSALFSLRWLPWNTDRSEQTALHIKYIFLLDTGCLRNQFVAIGYGLVDIILTSLQQSVGSAISPHCLWSLIQGLVENYAQVIEYLLMGFAGSKPDVWLALSIMEWQQWSMDCYLLTSCTAEKWKAGIPVSESLGTWRSIKKQMRQNRKKSAWLRSQELPSLHSFPWSPSSGKQEF